MVNHTCIKCNKEFKKKSHYLDHINKKFSCIKTPETLFDPPEKLQKNTENVEKIKKIDENIENIENFNLSCQFCGLVFNRKDNLNRHIKDRCKVKKLQDEEKENIFKILLAKEEDLKKKIEELEQNNLNLQKKYNESQFDNKNLQKNYIKIEKSNKELENNNKNLIKSNKKLEEKINEYNTTINNNNKQINEFKNINIINNNLIKYEELTNDTDNDNESNNIVIDNNIIMSRETDKYINATQLCKAGNKKFSHWNSLDSTKNLISVLESEAGIPASQLVDIKKGKSAKFEQGVWLHPDLAIQLAQWINPNFALQVSKWIRILFSKGKVNFKLIKKQEEKINRSTKKIKELETMVLKKQKREIYTGSNVIYMLTTQDHKKRNIYIIGKATNLTDRLSTYNKTCDHEVIFYKSCENEENMNLSEKLILNKLDKYREVTNRDRFVLPKDEDIKLFIDVINKYI
jgi:hypothetical protein